jgi:hypothetical protein
MFSNELWQKSGGTYSIDQSIRFNDPDNPKLGKTFSGAGTEETWTFSCWIKLGIKTSNGRRMIFSAGSAGSNYGGAEIGSAGDDSIEFYNYVGGSYAWQLVTTQQFRDPAAWYHLVFISDTTNSTEADRARIYVNGVRVTSFSTASYPSLNYASNFWMGTTEHEIGTSIFTTQNFDGYMAEIVNLDGTATDCNSFAEFNSSGIWIPKDVSGLTFGTNGFHIDGRDASDLGDDESGQGNDFSSSGLAAHDQVSDSPSNNFAVLNPIDTHNKLVGELRNGNLELKDNSANAYVYGRATFGFDVTDSNGFYWESCDIVDGSGIGGITEDNTALPSGSSLAFTGARGYNSINTSNHYKLENTTYNSVDLGVASNAGDIVQFCVKNGKLFIGINGTYVLSGNPATEANPLFTGLTGIFMPFAGLYSGASYNTVYNFGQDGTFAGNKTAQGNTDANDNGNFFYAPPSGAKALCSKSLGS